MSALNELDSKRFNRVSRIANVLSVQQKAREINPRLVRRLARTLIAAGVSNPAIERTARYGCKRHAQPKKHTA